MTKQLKDAAQKALTALEGLITWDAVRNYPVPYRVRDPIHEAINALRSALAAPQAEPQPVAQEPVAYRYRPFSIHDGEPWVADNRWILIERPGQIDAHSSSMGAVAEPLYTAHAAAVAQPEPVGEWRWVPVEPTPEMIDAYLKANAGYWVEADKLTPRPDKWREGTPKQATAVGYAALIAAAPQPAEPSAINDECEACALVCEEVATWAGTTWRNAALDCAKWVRARKIGPAEPSHQHHRDSAELRRLCAVRDSLRKSKRDLSDAYVRLRVILGAMDPPQGGLGRPAELWAYVEGVARERMAEKTAPCCAGGPQWGHAWDCKKLP